MKRWQSYVLLMGALLGLFAQQAAFASPPSMQVSEHGSISAGMTDDCAVMMALTVPSDFDQQPDKPCQGLTVDCIGKMGCALPVALILPAMPVVPTVYRPGAPAFMSVAPLVGRNFGPEPEPPASLG